MADRARRHGCYIAVGLVEVAGEALYNSAGVRRDDETDYPVYAARVARAVASGNYDRGILFCSTGVGMSIAANNWLSAKYKGGRHQARLDLVSRLEDRLDIG